MLLEQLQLLLPSAGIIVFSVLGGMLLHLAYTRWTGINPQQDESAHLRNEVQGLQASNETLNEENGALKEQLNQLNTQHSRLQVEFNELEEQWKTDRQHLEVADEKTTMSRNFAHDLGHTVEAVRNTLSKLEELQFDNIEEEARVRQIQRQLRNQISVIADNIRDIKRFLVDFGEDKTAKLKLTRSNIKEICAKVRDARTDLAKQQNVALWMRSPRILPEVEVDAEYIGRVLTNLVDNAIKYADSGKPDPYVGIELSVDEADNNMIIKVRDNGRGMSPSLVPALWNESLLSLEQRHHHIEGSGLGLAIVKLYIDAHEGASIEVESVEDKGSTFTIKLPYEPEG